MTVAPLNLLLDFVEFGMLPPTAVRAPRFATHDHRDSFNPIPNREQAFIAAGSLTLDTGVDKRVETEPASRSHKLQVTAGPAGAPVILYIELQRGAFRDAGDPAAHRHAAGLR